MFIIAFIIYHRVAKYDSVSRRLKELWIAMEKGMLELRWRNACMQLQEIPCTIGLHSHVEVTFYSAQRWTSTMFHNTIIVPEKEYVERDPQFFDVVLFESHSVRQLGPANSIRDTEERKSKREQRQRATLFVIADGE